MPHKRAKRPVREREKAQRPADLPPKLSIEHEPVPKSVSRVLNAGQIRREYRKKKRQLERVGDSDEGDVGRKKRRHDANGVEDGVGRTGLKIRPSETVPQFNRRVENAMMPVIRSALRQSSAQARKVRREEVAEETLKRGKHRETGRLPLPESLKEGPDLPPTAADDKGAVNPRRAAKEFEVISTCAPRRLNDIAQEPPTIKKLPRGAAKNDAAPSGVLSMAQKAMMEEERERVIVRYRELKARKLRDCGGARRDG